MNKRIYLLIAVCALGAAGLAAGQVAGGRLGYEAQFVDGFLHAAGRLFAHPGRAVEHAADRGDRDPRSIGHVGDGMMPGIMPGIVLSIMPGIVPHLKLGGGHAG